MIGFYLQIKIKTTKLMDKQIMEEYFQLKQQ